jgi:hypothetical protein
MYDLLFNISIIIFYVSQLKKIEDSVNILRARPKPLVILASPLILAKASLFLNFSLVKSKAIKASLLLVYTCTYLLVIFLLLFVIVC